MVKRYQVTFGDSESLLIEAVALDRGIPVATLIRECALAGLSTSYWKGMRDTTLNSDMIKLTIPIQNAKEKFWEVLQIPAGIEKGYISCPDVKFVDPTKEKTWTIVKAPPITNDTQALWTENGSLKIYPVYTGDRIMIVLPIAVDAKKDLQSISVRLAYKEISQGPLIRKCRRIRSG